MALPFIYSIHKRVKQIHARYGNNNIIYDNTATTHSKCHDKSSSNSSSSSSANNITTTTANNTTNNITTQIPNTTTISNDHNSDPYAILNVGRHYTILQSEQYILSQIHTINPIYANRLIGSSGV